MKEVNEGKTAQSEKGNVSALLPIAVFLVLYLGLGILFEYVLGISMGFYNIPIVPDRASGRVLPKPQAAV